MLRNVANQEVYFTLFDGSDRVENPTIAVGDFKVDLDFAGQVNVTTPPTADAAGLVRWEPTQAETNGAHVNLVCLDAAGAEWDPLTVENPTLDSTTIAAAATAAALAVVDGIVDDILVDTSVTIPALIAALNDPTPAAIADAVWDEVIAGHLTAGTAGLYLSYLGGGQITTSTPVTLDSDVNLYEGDSYYDADGNSLEWTDTGSAWPTLTAATITMYVRSANGEKVNAPGTVVVAVGPGKKVRVELSAAQTTALVDLPSPSEYRTRATLASGHIVTLAAGNLTTYTDIS